LIEAVEVGGRTKGGKSDVKWGKMVSDDWQVGYGKDRIIKYKLLANVDPTPTKFQLYGVKLHGHLRNGKM
jgi:hypothetical protein